MRRDPRPYWLYKLQRDYEAWWARRFLAPQFDALGPDPMISRPWHVEVFGRGVRAGRALHVLASRDAPVRLTVWAPPEAEASLTLGDCVLLTGGVRLLAAKAIDIGAGAMFAKDAVVTDCDWHGLYDRTAIDADARPVRIGANVWIGDGVYVGKGVSIGANTVVGARSVVVKDLPANVVAVGNPAQPVRDLDAQGPWRTREDLLADPPALARFMDGAYRDMLGDNTFPGWFKARFAPGPED
ncbi:MAG: acyltransferase [Maricaulaceae bacterium]